MKKGFLALTFNMVLYAHASSTDSLEQPLLSIFSPPATEQSITISSTSQAILHVFYTTQHLLPIMALIKKITERSRYKEQFCVQRLVLFFSDTNLLKSAKIKTVFSHIKQTHSLVPLHQVWEQIRHFRYGINPTEKNVLLDFSKLCLVAYQSILSSSHQKNNLGALSFTPEDLDHLEIDQVFETLEKYSALYFLRHSSLTPLTLQRPSASYASNGFCASFALRYYLTKRLHASFSLFTSLQNRNMPIFLHGVEHLGFKKEDLIFNDPVIAGYFSLLLEEKHLGPLMQLIGQFQSFDFIKNATFTKEFLVLLCLIYKDTFTIRSTETFDELQELSIEQILTLIDMVNEKYSKRISAYAEQPLILPRSLCQTKIADLSSISTLIKTEYDVTPDAFTNMVFHRYYYIKRLEAVAKILLKLTARTLSYEQTKTSLFLKPLAMAWDDFKVYREIGNQKLIEDFIKEIFILSLTVLNSPANQQYAHILQAFLPSQTTTASRPYKNLSQEQNDLFADFRPWIKVDKVIGRFYLLKRMESVFHTLDLLNHQGLLHLGCSSANAELDPCLEQLNIQKEPILTMIRAIYSTHSFRPLFSFWNNLNRYKHIQDEEIMGEFARFVTHLLHTTATHHAIHHCSPLFIEGKGHFSLDQLQEMPLEDILNLLDILVEELPEFLEKNEIHLGMDWKEWLKKYWLLFPLSTAIFAIKVYIMSRDLEISASSTAPSYDPSATPIPS